jgi:predicted transcriptional regulator of viral defense system
MRTSQAEQILTLARAKAVIRASDLAPLGISRAVLRRLVDAGALLQVGRGLYMSPDAQITPYHSLVKVVTRVPKAVVNLLSALAFHDLTDELPHAVWIAIRRGSQVPLLDGPRLELTWVSPALIDVGVTRHPVEGIELPVTNPDRTVIDCFTHRSKVGLDVAIAALRAYLARERMGRVHLWDLAGRFRVQRVIRPYLETLS